MNNVAFNLLKSDSLKTTNNIIFLICPYMEEWVFLNVCVSFLRKEKQVEGENGRNDRQGRLVAFVCVQLAR